MLRRYQRLGPINLNLWAALLPWCRKPLETRGGGCGALLECKVKVQQGPVPYGVFIRIRNPLFVSQRRNSPNKPGFFGVASLQPWLRVRLPQLSLAALVNSLHGVGPSMSSSSFLTSAGTLGVFVSVSQNTPLPLHTYTDLWSGTRGGVRTRLPSHSCAQSPCFRWETGRSWLNLLSSSLWGQPHSQCTDCLVEGDGLWPCTFRPRQKLVVFAVLLWL